MERFMELYETVYRDMYRLAYYYMGNGEDAEDAVHNAFLQILKHFKTLQNASAGDLAPQIAVTTKNEAISLLRKRRGSVPLEDRDGFSETLEAVTGYQALVDSFTRPPQTYRAVMEMKLLLGYSDGEIAAKLGLTKTAVNTRISRGRRLLRDIVAQEGFLQDA